MSAMAEISYLHEDLRYAFDVQLRSANSVWSYLVPTDEHLAELPRGSVIQDLRFSHRSARRGGEGRPLPDYVIVKRLEFARVVETKMAGTQRAVTLEEA